jgi:outer membrane protein assembly factor BamB
MSARFETMDWKDLGPARTEIKSVKAIQQNTPLVSAERGPEFVIACPDAPAYFDLAYGLQEAILGSLSGPVRVKVPADITERDRQERHVIALGNIGNNSLLGDLYHSYYAAVDHAYPGRGGHILQTVYDPWGHGTNVIVCGGSDLVGVRAAVEAASGALEAHAGAKWFPRLHDIVVGADFEASYPRVSFACTPEYRQQMIAHTYERLEQGMHRGATPPVSHAGLMYHLTGDTRFAELYRDLFKIMYQDAVNDPGTGPWSPWGFDADFQSAPMWGAWDVVEEAPVFSDEDRLYITNHLLWYLQYMAEHARGHRPAQLRSPRHNHYTFAALGVLYGAKYFQKYYGLPEVEEWLALADECFQTQAGAFKANEDCNSYQWLTFYHTLKYALVRPDPAFIANGLARFCMDLGIATMDNLGYQVPYGDVREYAGTFSEVPYYKAVAWLTNDPVYQPVLSRKEQVRPERDPDGIQPVGYEYEVHLGKGRIFGQFLGVSASPVEPIYFEHFDGPAQIDYKKTFDKVVFRHSLHPADDYLLLDGLSNGGHLHRDGNSILRYTSKERIWLADADYMKSPQKFHNSLLVFKEGRGALIPDYAELGEATWLEPLGYARSTMRNYCGTDWIRHILEVRNEGFIVFDEVVAREPGHYDLRCLWRTIGDVALDSQERVFTVEQEGPRMEIVSAPGFAAPTDLVLKEEPMIWASWDRYPYHGQTADVKVLQERVSLHLAAGDCYAFVNLLGTDGPYPRLHRVSERLAFLDGEKTALVGSGDALSKAGGALAADAAFVYLSADRVFLAGVSVLSLRGSQALSASSPLSVAIDWSTGQVAVAASQATELHLAGTEQPQAIVPGHHVLSVAWLGEAQEAAREVIDALVALPEEAGPEKREVKQRPQGAQPAWELALPEVPYAVRLDTAQAGQPASLYIGTVDGSLYRIDEGQVSWAFRLGGRVNSIAVADVRRTGQCDVILGSADHYVYLLDAAGKELWRRELPYYMHDPTVEAVIDADLGLAAGRAVIAGSNNCHVHAFSPDGEELWRYEVIHGVNDLTAADMTGDGRDEILSVTEWWTWHCIDAAGKGLWPVWSIRPHYAPGANVVRAADVNGDGVPEMVCGAIDSCVYAFDKTGKRLWEFFSGEEISALECVDLDGDGVAEIVAGSMNGYVYALDGRGQEIWHCGLGEEVNSLVVLQGSQGTRIVAGTDGPLVSIIDEGGHVLSSLDTGSALRKVTARAVPGGIQLYAVSRDGRVAAYHVPVAV